MGMRTRINFNACLQYLEGLFEARPADVRTFMEARPFCPSAPGPSATAPSAQAPTVQPQRPSRTAPVAVATTAELDRMMSRLAVGPAAQSLITPASEAVVPSAIPVNYSTTTAVVRPAAAASASIASEADPANAHAVVASSTSPPSFTVEPHATTAATPNATTIAETTSSSGPAAANDLNQAAAAGNQMRIADVPRGVSLLFRCMEGGRFMLSRCVVYRVALAVYCASYSCVSNIHKRVDITYVHAQGVVFS